MKRPVPCWQFAVLLSVLAFLWWDSEPVPGPDGRVVATINEFSRPDFARFRSISLYEARPGWETLAAHAPILRVREQGPNETLQALAGFSPPLRDLLPRRLLIDGGWVLEVSLTPEEWCGPRDARRRHKPGSLAYHLHE